MILRSWLPLGLFSLLLALCACRVVSFPLPAPQRLSCAVVASRTTTSSPSSTALFGLRSFLRRKIQGEQPLPEEEEQDEPREEAVIIEETPPAPPKLRMAENPTTKQVDAYALAESVQERINRVKSGKMTDDEKQAFLRTALTAGATIEQRQPLIAPKKEEPKKPKKTNNTTPLILKTNPTDEARKQKQAYVDMVTNPDRFKSKAIPPKDTAAAAPSSSTDLGERLGQAALQMEQNRQRQEEERREREWQQKEAQRLAMERKQVDLAKERASQQDDARRRRLSEQDESMILRSKREKDQVEQQRMQQLIQQQEDYWNKKLGRVAPADEPAAFNPDESELLREAEEEREHDWEENQEIIQRSAARFDPNQLNDVQAIQSESDFRNELSRQKSDVDRFRDEQMERLKAMNSPLPEIPDRRAPIREKPVQRERMVEKPLPPLEPSMEATDEEVDEEEEDEEETVQANGSPAPGWRNLFSGPKEAPAKKFAPPAPAPVVAVAPPPPAHSPPPPPPATGAAPKAPIRMSLPIDDELDEDEDGVDARSNPKMSIAEAMKRTEAGASGDQEERSKKWGVDMSRFT